MIYEFKSCIDFSTKKLYIADTNITDKDYAKKVYDEFDELCADNFIVAHKYGLSYPYDFNERLWYKIRTNSLLNEIIKFKEVDL